VTTGKWSIILNDTVVSTNSIRKWRDHVCWTCNN